MLNNILKNKSLPLIVVGVGVAVILMAIIIPLIFQGGDSTSNTPSPSTKKTLSQNNSFSRDVEKERKLITTISRRTIRRAENVVLNDSLTTYLINLKGMGEWRLGYVEINPSHVDLTIDTGYGIYTHIPDKLTMLDENVKTLKIQTKTPLVFSRL